MIRFFLKYDSVPDKTIEMAYVSTFPFFRELIFGTRRMMNHRGTEILNLGYFVFIRQIQAPSVLKVV
jgi:hypothetical protein